MKGSWQRPSGEGSGREWDGGLAAGWDSEGCAGNAVQLGGGCKGMLTPQDPRIIE